MSPISPTCIITNIIVDIDHANLLAGQHVRVPDASVVGIVDHIEQDVRRDILELGVYLDHMEVAATHRLGPHVDVALGQLQRPARVLVHQLLELGEIQIIGYAGHVLQRACVCIIVTR